MKRVLRLTESELIKLVKQVIQEQDVIDFESNIEECFDIIPRFYFGITTGRPGRWDGGDLSFWNKNEIPELDDEEAYHRFISHLKDTVGYEHDGKGGMEYPEMIISDDCFDYDNPPSWKELLPYIKQMYYDTIRKKKMESQIQSLNSHEDAMKLAKQMFAGKSKDKLTDIVNKLSKKYNIEIPLNIRRRLSDSTLVSQISKEIDLMSPDEFDEPYDYADNILEKVINNNYSYFMNSLSDDQYYEMYDEFLEYIKDNFADIILDYWADVRGFDFE